MKHFFLTLLGILIISLNSTFAQTEKPVTVTSKIENLGNNKYQLVIEANMKEGFHIWAPEPGGDEFLIPSKVNLNTVSSDIKWVDADWQIDQKPKTARYEFFDLPVNFFEKKVKFTKTFTSTSKKFTLSGTFSYQSCNESMCFPPEDYVFEVKK